MSDDIILGSWKLCFGLKNKKLAAKNYILEHKLDIFCEQGMD